MKQLVFWWTATGRVCVWPGF